MSDETSSSSTQGSDMERKWDSLPADSEAAVDYPTEDSTEEPVEELHEQPLGKVLNIYNGKMGEYFELAVEMVVRTPDGTVLRYEETVEKKDRDDYGLDEAAEVAHSVYGVMADRLSR